MRVHGPPPFFAAFLTIEWELHVLQREAVHERASAAGVRSLDHEAYVLTPPDEVTFSGGKARIHFTTDNLLKSLSEHCKHAAADSTYKVGALFNRCMSHLLCAIGCMSHLC